MANFLSLFFLLLSLSAIATEAQVPANETFKYINTGEFGDRIIEYDASYRWIETPDINNEFQNRDFFSYPFRPCFYNTTPNSFILAIRAGVQRDESLMRWVWDANRNDPVRENATLTFGPDGNLVLADVDGRIVWQTNTRNKGVVDLRMLDNGNLVLRDKNGKFIWQSFDFPTDTLLVGQSLKINGRNKLVSRKSDMDGSDGPYSMILDRTGLTMYLNHSGQLLTYGGWPGRGGTIATFDAQPENSEEPSAYELVLTISVEEQRRRLLQVRPIGSGSGRMNLNKLNYNATISFLRLGSDGNLKAYTYFDKVSYLRWEESFSFFSPYFVRECGLPTKCGSYGYCTKAMCVACPTPKGLLGWSESCSPPKVPACGTKGNFSYYKIVGVEHFMNPYQDEKEGQVKFENCKGKCDRDCKCLGFIYKEHSSKCLRIPLLGTLIKDNSSSIGYIKYSI